MLVGLLWGHLSVDLARVENNENVMLVRERPLYDVSLSYVSHV